MNTPPVASAAPSPSRLLSLDALRGFDMFWILGADALVLALGATTQSPPVRAISAQLVHKDWAGFAFYDLIFPLFVFIVGVSLVFSLTQLVTRHGRAAAVKRILTRAALLFAFGIFYNGGLAEPWPDVRLVGVLQRIAFAYAVVGLLFVFLKPRVLAIITGALLLGYWALLAWTPVRGVQLDRTALAARLPEAARDADGFPDPTRVRELFNSSTPQLTGRYDPGLNLPNHFDYQYLPGWMYDHYYDPEGLISNLPAVASCLLGVFAGLLLRRPDLVPSTKVRALLLGGAIALAAGWIWHLEFPVIKKLWTSSYVLVAGGWSLLLLAAFYYLIDVRGWQRWATPFVWIGLNPITLYLLSSIVSFQAIASRLVGGSIGAWFDRHLGQGAGTILITVVGLALVFAFARFLHVRRIYLRV